MDGFTKLHSGIIYSSIWEEDNYTRILWITMLAMSNSTGEVIVAPKRLYKVANIPADKCRLALKKLSSPDADSRTSDNEGRRIEKIQGGWLILNYFKYRATPDVEKRRQQNREAKRRERMRKTGVSASVSKRQHDVSNVSQNQHIAEAEAEADNTLGGRGGKGEKKFKKPSAQEVEAYAKSIDFAIDGNEFVDFYESKGWMIGKSRMKEWKAAVRNWKARRREKNKTQTHTEPLQRDASGKTPRESYLGDK